MQSGLFNKCQTHETHTVTKNLEKDLHHSQYIPSLSFQGFSMNNLNDPPRWNIRPEAAGGDDGARWNYALLVPMIGLAAFR